MLFYGNIQNIQDQCVIYNLTSYAEGFRRLNNLIPPNYIKVSPTFDLDYYNYIFCDDNRFMTLFEIVDQVIKGIDVYILVADADWSDEIVLSLFKTIQQRYGINATKVGTFDDVLYSNVPELNKGYGLFNYDEDCRRYEAICDVYDTGNGGQPC